MNWKIKVFQATNPNVLENYVNNFFESYSNGLEMKDIKYSSAYNNSVGAVYYSVMITYR
jgi:hypothetical protein